jgi:hypothetical protein
MPKGRGRHGGGESSGPGGTRGCGKERVEVTRAIAPGDHAVSEGPSQKGQMDQIQWNDYYQ